MWQGKFNPQPRFADSWSHKSRESQGNIFCSNCELCWYDKIRTYNVIWQEQGDLGVIWEETIDKAL